MINKKIFLLTLLILFIILSIFSLFLFFKYIENSYNKSVDEALEPVVLKDILPNINYSVDELVYSTITVDPPDASTPQIDYPNGEEVNEVLSDINLEVEVEEENKMKLISNEFEYEIDLVEDNSDDILQSGRGGYKKYSEDNNLPDTPNYKDPLFTTKPGEYIEQNSKKYSVGVADLDGVNYLTVASNPYNYVLSLEAI